MEEEVDFRLAMAETETETETRENVVLFPFMMQGHIIPFLALAHHIANLSPKHYTITIVNTPQNIAKLRSSLPPSSSIRLRELPFSAADHGLPAGSENSDTLPYPLIIRLLHAASSLRPAFRDFIEQLIADNHGRRPLCILADIFLGWTTAVAAEFGVFHAVFSGASGFGLACYYSIWLSLPHLKAEGDDFELEDFPEAARIHVTQLPFTISAADGTDPWSVFQRKNLTAWVNSDAVLFNTVEEFDHLGLSYFRRKLNRPAWAAILPMGRRLGSGKESGISPEKCKNWLDTKPQNSVLYISFGSHNTLLAAQMLQLAVALEASGKNFIWVVRPPIGFDINGEFRAEEWLPEGFERRISESGRGLLIRKWAPQVEILGHKSVGAFLSHCGWNSTVEALSHGVPMVGWALAAEQFFNVILLAEKMGVCVEVARGKEEVREEELREKIEIVMEERSEKGKEMRRKAWEVKEIIENSLKNSDGFKGSSIRAMDELFKAAMTKRDR